MPNRTQKFVSAVFASVLAGAILASATDVHAKASEDNCLSAPKGATPAGAHWYYRIDRATKRNCWYIKNENDKSERAAPQDSSSAPQASKSASAPVNLVPPQPSTSVRKSIADARAELTSPPMRVEQDASVNVDPRVNATAAPAGVESNQRAAATAAPASLITSRWPDTAAVSPSGDLRVAAADPAESPSANAEAAPQPAVSPVALAAADPPLEKQSASMQMLFLVMAGALALAGLTASVVFRFGRARAKQSDIRGSRRINWDSVHTGSSPPMFPTEDGPMWRRDAPASTSHNRRDARAPDDPERRVTELLSRLARSAQT